MYLVTIFIDSKLYKTPLSACQVLISVNILENFDSGSLKEQVVVLPGSTPGVTNKNVATTNPKPVAVYGTYGDTSLPYLGVVYRRWLIKPGCVDNGKSYVGETMDEASRIQSWKKINSPDYGGYKISSARNQYGLKDWKYEVLEIVYAKSKDECRKLLYKREAYYIDKYNSYENGFNGNRGGAGNTGVVFDEARRKQNGDNRRGKPQSAATKEILRQKSTGRIKSDEERQKISAGNTGKKRTSEMRKAQSQRMKGKEPKAATIGAEKWREKNGGGSWNGKKIPATAIAKRNETRRESSQRIKVTASDGTVACYLCQADAAKATGLKDGSVNYALNRPDGMHAKSGNKFKRITDAEYQAWRSANP